ncbi:MAG: ChrR family anti-sigma-E factor [Gammaproteobacteria bacterium]|nr:cupin domain-containing protein [Pseudomonadales bacterium]
MTTQTNHHPSQDLLKTFSEGQLSTGMSIAISAHLDYCSSCRQSVEVYESELASEWVATDPGADGPQLSESNILMDRITSQPQVVPITQATRPRRPVELHMHERSVRLPGVLSRVAEKGVVWKKLAGGINTAKLTLDRDAQCDFMYMKPGSQAPRHTHRGLEVTLVLDGTFEDELGEYRPGDFVLRESTQVHTPRSDEGCLCYSVLDSPLLFTSGWSRLLNPFQRLLFNRQLRHSH